ncbi:hypothetical protein N0M98_03075 [Paenibacillus doosanensis]|uniref:Uncharacterized protein n=2 Tax=Paenibacillus TaxID=44249 RepID=A0ABY4RPY3_9BACL|nr:hypothetical protein [Paenibacillus doosanensis]UQZ84168.1 hypothetical protein SK3146_03401 [Paenibacillus konkukensis]
MSIVDVAKQIQQLKHSGETMSKKKIKQSHPELLQNALYYFPSWEHAIQSSESL